MHEWLIMVTAAGNPDSEAECVAQNMTISFLTVARETFRDDFDLDEAAAAAGIISLDDPQKSWKKNSPNRRKRVAETSSSDFAVNPRVYVIYHRNLLHESLPHLTSIQSAIYSK